MITLKNALEYTENALIEQGIDEAEFKALCLVCHVADIRNREFFINSKKQIEEQKLYPLINRLSSGEPLQYIIGKWDFFESEFFVGEGVLIPRPETEELTMLAVKEAEKIKNPVVFDLCAGSGCIGISIAKKIASSKVICIEKSEKAFEFLKMNSKGVNNVCAVLADINDELDLPKADIIVSNPPYIRSGDISTLDKELSFEPKMALDGGEDGLDFYRIIKEKYFPNLKKGGMLLLEIGNEQGNDLKDLFCGFDTRIIKDMYGNDRIVKVSKD